LISGQNYVATPKSNALCGLVEVLAARQTRFPAGPDSLGAAVARVCVAAFAAIADETTP